MIFLLVLHSEFTPGFKAVGLLPQDPSILRVNGPILRMACYIYYPFINPLNYPLTIADYYNSTLKLKANSSRVLKSQQVTDLPLDPFVFEDIGYPNLFGGRSGHFDPLPKTTFPVPPGPVFRVPYMRHIFVHRCKTKILFIVYTLIFLKR